MMIFRQQPDRHDDHHRLGCRRQRPRNLRRRLRSMQPSLQPAATQNQRNAKSERVLQRSPQALQPPYSAAFSDSC